MTTRPICLVMLLVTCCTLVAALAAGQSKQGPAPAARNRKIARLQPGYEASFVVLDATPLAASTTCPESVRGSNRE
jgi:hypothetical protein